VPAEQPISEHARRAARTYGAAADHYSLANFRLLRRSPAKNVPHLLRGVGKLVQVAAYFRHLPELL